MAGSTPNDRSFPTTGPKPVVNEPRRTRINISLKTALLKKIDEVAGPYERSAFISSACQEKLDFEYDIKTDKQA